MATVAFGRQRVQLNPDRIDRLLAGASILLLTFVVTALARGYGQWTDVPRIVWAHILTILIALALTPVMLLRRRGDRRHRRLGWIWATSMALTALFAFGIRGINAGSLSVIHLLAAWTLIQVPLIIWAARTHHHARHRNNVRGMVFGALLLAGFFTFPFDRLMGRWLFG